MRALVTRRRRVLGAGTGVPFRPSDTPTAHGEGRHRIRPLPHGRVAGGRGSIDEGAFSMPIERCRIENRPRGGKSRLVGLGPRDGRHGRIDNRSCKTTVTKPTGGKNFRVGICPSAGPGTGRDENRPSRYSRDVRKATKFSRAEYRASDQPEGCLSTPPYAPRFLPDAGHRPPLTGGHSPPSPPGPVRHGAG